MRTFTMILAVVVAMVTAVLAGTAYGSTIAMPDGSIGTGAGTYQQAYHFFDTAQNPESPDRWNVVASDLTFEGEVNISDINAKARWNTWDDNLGDGVDKLGAWYMCGPYAGSDGASGRGVWWTGVQWTGGGDLATDIRQIFHMQDRQGTQPSPRWWTGPYTQSGWEWLDDWFSFKLVVHATSATTGTGTLWINNQLLGPETESGASDTFAFDLTGAPDDLTNMRIIMWMINGNNPNNPSYTFAWRNASVTGTPVPEPVTLGLVGLGALVLLLRRR